MESESGWQSGRQMTQTFAFPVWFSSKDALCQHVCVRV